MRPRVIVASLKQAQELQRTRDALRRIREWNSHPKGCSLLEQFEFYRDIAQEALDGKRHAKARGVGK